MSQAGSKLGGLPDLSYGQVLAQPAPVARNPNPGGIWNELANAAEDIGKKFQPELNKEAAKQGADSVTRDANGNLVYKDPGQELTEADRAYANAAHLKYMNEAALDLQPKLLDLQTKYANDPQGFRVGLDALVTGATKNAPPDFQQPIQEMLLESGKGLQAQLIQRKQVRDVNAAEQTANATIEMDRNSLHGYARSGTLDDPQAQIALNRATANMRAKAGNPLFNYSPAEAEQDISELTSQLKAETILGHVDDMYTRLGEKGAIAQSEKMLDDPALNISPAERNQIASQARQRIRELHAGTVNEQAELQRQVEYRLDDANASALVTGKWTDVVSVDDITKAYASNPPRAAQIIGKLNASAEIYSMKKGVGMATPGRLAEMEADLNPSKNGAGKVPEGYDALWSKWILPTEGGYSPADSNGAPVNFGINQKANPDIDVKSLTPAKAAQVIKDRYFVASGADKLSGGLAAVQLDTAVNMGVDTAKDLLAKSGGDVKTYLDLREQKYRAIAAQSPDKAKNLPAWLERNENLRNFAGGGNIADQARIYQAFHEAVNQRNQALNSDPAAYVLGNRQDIAGMIGSKDPGQVQTGIRSLLAVERDLGAPTSDVLSKGAAQNIINQFNNPADPDHRAEGMNDVINGMAQRYGSYFPQVMQELTRKGMPDEAYALLLTRGDPGTASRMANAINNRKPLEKLMEGNPDKKDVDQGVTTALADLSRTVSAQGDGAATMARLTGAARLYAYQLVQEGVPASKAADTAAHDVISQHYTVQGSYRVPKGVDAGAVSSGADAFQSAISDKDLAPMGSLVSPTASQETKQQMTAQIARRKAIWVTTPDESGLQLVWPMELGYAPVRDAKGQVIRRSWGQLQGKGGGGVQAPSSNEPWDAILKGLN
jgi:lysozyme family protein